MGPWRYSSDSTKATLTPRTCAGQIAPIAWDLVGGNVERSALQVNIFFLEGDGMFGAVTWYDVMWFDMIWFFIYLYTYIYILMYMYTHVCVCYRYIQYIRTIRNTHNIIYIYTYTGTYLCAVLWCTSGTLLERHPQLKFVPALVASSCQSLKMLPRSQPREEADGVWCPPAMAACG